MNEACICGHSFDGHEKPKSGISWDVCSFPCSQCGCTEFEAVGCELIIKPVATNSFRIEYGTVRFQIISDKDEVIAIFPTSVQTYTTINGVHFQPVVVTEQGGVKPLNQ